MTERQSSGTAVVVVALMAVVFIALALLGGCGADGSSLEVPQGTIGGER